MRATEYYTLNVKVLPVKDNPTKAYERLINNWFEKGYRIPGTSSNAYYFTLTHLHKIRYTDDNIYYAVLTKFVNLDELDFVDAETGELLEFDIPENIEARSQQYELLFFPKYHRFAFIKKGKVDPNVKKRGAPLKQMMSIIKKAFENGLPDNEHIIMDIEQSEQIFSDIFTNVVRSLQVDVSYTNDDHLRKESKKFVDGMLRDSKIGRLHSRLQPDNSGRIDTNTDLVDGLLNLAQENGSVKATVEYDDGEIKRIDTTQHPAVGEVRGFASENPVFDYARELFSRFTSKYGPKKENGGNAG